MKNQQTNQQQRGAVSLFVVLFTSLLVIIITVGFVQLMVRNQQQATQSDLSQSAYDSALAGVEDAKRAMVLARKCASDASISITLCPSIDAKLDSNQCSTLSNIFDVAAPNEKERTIQQSASDATLDQAYTCVKVIQNTPDYVRKYLRPEKSHLVPLRVASGDSFDKIEIQWFTRGDVGENFTSNNDLPSNHATFAFPMSDPLEGDVDEWKISAPPLLRTQVIKTDGNFTLSSFDTAGGSSNVSTLFLYPSNAGIPISLGAGTADPGVAGPLHSEPQSVNCQNDNFKNGGYACTVTLNLGSSISGGYLRLSSLYNTTSYRVVMKNSAGSVVPFHGVQPEVDSTGRANDLFRRVKARVQFESTDFPYPEDTVDLYGSLCKDFSVGSKVEHYKAGACNVAELE